MSVLGPSLSGVYFGMLQPELQRARPRVVRQPRGDDPRHFMLVEALPSGERVIYWVDRQSLVLTRLQIATKLGSVADIAPRIAQMQARFGSPQGIWDCPVSAGQLPTRRFTYQRSAVAVMDSYLVTGENASATLYFADEDTLRASLKVARCEPTPQDRLSQFPIVPPTAK